MSTSAQAIPGLIELGRKNQPNGYVGIDESGDVIGTFAQRYDTAANIAAIVLAAGELAYTSDTQETFIGDGVTEGGLFLWQKPQQQFKSIATVAPASSPYANSILFPNHPQARYLITIDASCADPDTISNFALQVNMQAWGEQLWTGELSAWLREQWFNSAGLVIETRYTPQTTGGWASFGVKAMLKEAANLTLAAARVRVEMYATRDIAAGGGFDGGPIAISGVPRTGTTSAGNITAVATCQRIK